MKMLKGQKWICSNSTCRSQFVVTVPSEPEGGVNPTCCCGSKMKKVYVRPTFWRIQNSRDSKTLHGNFLSEAG